MSCGTLVRRTLAAALLAAPLGAAPAGAQQSAPAPDPRRPLPADPAVAAGTLPNGLRYYVRANPKPEKRAELRLVVNAGSVLEDENQRGLAHFVEHMAFNGTQRYAKQALVDYLERIGMRFGADLNASTSFDETVYMLQVPTDSAHLLRTGFEILDQWAHAITFDSAEVAKERGVVIEEWRGNRGATARMFDKQLPVIFQGSRYAERVPIGTVRTLETATAAELRKFYSTWYRPDLMAVVAVGDFDRDSMVALVKRQFGDLPAAKNARPRPSFPVPDHDSTLVSVATDPEATGTSVTLLYKQPLRQDHTVGGYRQQIVESLFNSMLNDRLYELTQKPDAPFLRGASGQGRFIRTKEVYTLGAAVRDGGVERGLEALLTEAERVDEHGFTATELERARKDLIRAYEQQYAERAKSNSSTYAGEYVTNFLTGDPYPGIAAEYELVKLLAPGITLADVNRLAREWITDRNRAILVSAPEKAGAAVPTAAQLLAVFKRVQGAQVAAYADTVSDAPLIAAPPVPGRVVSEKSNQALGTREWTLANGVRVIVKPTDFKDDEVLLSAHSPGGTSLAPDQSAFSAALAPQVVALGGVSRFNAIELQKKLAGAAVRVSPYITEETEGISGSASPRDLETMLQLVHLYFTAPREDSTAFAAFVANARASLANRGRSPQAAFQDTLQVTLAQHHPRERPLTAARLDELDLRTALRFYRDRFADASDFTFVVVGSVTPDSLRPLVERYLGSLPATRRKESWKDLGIVPPKGVVAREVRAGIEPKAQTQLVFTGPFQYTPANRFALRALGDVLNIKLREQLREELGGTYGVSVNAVSTHAPRPEYAVSISFGSAPERAEQLTRAVFAQIDSLQAKGATPDDVAKVKETQLRTRETSLKQNGFWLGQLSAYDQNGEDPRGILEYDKLVASLTPAVIRDAATRYLNEKNYVQVRLYPESGPRPAKGATKE